MFNWSLSQELMRMKKLYTVTEAPEDTDINTGVTSEDTGTDDLDATDYDAAASEMDDADQDGQPDPGTETAENDVEGDDLEAEDYSETEGEIDDTEVPDETAEEQEPEAELPDENGDKSKNRFLIRDFIDLYFTVENIIKKLNNNNKTNLLRSEVYLQVVQNLTDMNEVLYDYIKNDFSSKSYVFNLYQFNLFLEYININAEIIDKSGELQSNKQTNK